MHAVDQYMQKVPSGQSMQSEQSGSMYAKGTLWSKLEKEYLVHST